MDLKHVGTKLLSNRSIHQWCSIKKPYLKISQYSQENTCVGDSF